MTWESWTKRSSYISMVDKRRRTFNIIIIFIKIKGVSLSLSSLVLFIFVSSKHPWRLCLILYIYFFSLLLYILCFCWKNFMSKVCSILIYMKIIWRIRNQNCLYFIFCSLTLETWMKNFNAFKINCLSFLISFFGCFIFFSPLNLGLWHVTNSRLRNSFSLFNMTKQCENRKENFKNAKLLWVLIKHGHHVHNYSIFVRIYDYCG